MPEIGRWYGHVFEVSPEIVHSFTDLTVKGSAETEEQTLGDGQKIVALKNQQPAEISLTVHLDARFGCEDIREEAILLVREAQAGAKDYFYLGDKKLLPCQMMLISAEVGQISLTPMSRWIRCEVKLTMKQCEKADGTSGGSSGGGGGSGTKTTGTYKVQIPGMAILTVEAESVQDAITKTCGKWTGTVIVNDKSYKVVKGVIDMKDQVESAYQSRLNSPTELTNLQKAKAEISRITGNVEAAKEASIRYQKMVTPGTKPTPGASTTPAPKGRAIKTTVNTSSPAPHGSAVTQ